MNKEQEFKEMLKLYSKQDLWNRIQEKQAMIYDLQSQLAITEKALELACDVLRDINYKTFNDADVNFEAMFEKQAKEMLENE